MAGPNLSGVTPTLVTPLEPKYHTIVTQAESMKKSFINFSGSTPVYQYKLKWEGVSDATFYSKIHYHYEQCLGGYDSFTWKDVPGYIDANHDGTADGADMTARWVEGSLKMKPNPNDFDVEGILEQVI